MVGFSIKYQVASIKKMSTYRMIFGFIGALLAAQFTACKTEEFYFSEPVKDIGGTWKVIKVTRNDADITERAGNGFQITFQADSAGGSALTYEMGDNSLPFLVSKNGVWAFDDPAYPFTISFRPEGSEAVTTIPFMFPVTEGVRQISLSFSPGCNDNVYEYLLEEDNTQD